MSALKWYRENFAVASTGLVGGGAIFVATGVVGWPDAGETSPLALVSRIVAFEREEFWSFFAALFAIMNPLIAVPLFVRMTRRRDAAARCKLARTTSATVLLALITVALFGQQLLGFFAISVGAFRIAGGVIVLLMGLAMLQAKESEKEDGGPDGEAAATDGSSQFICPIAIPLLAGPGGIATIILQSKAAAVPSDYGMIACVIGLMVVLTYATLRLAVPIARVLGSTGLMVATRLIGMIVAAIAIDMMVIGLRLSFPHLL